MPSLSPTMESGKIQKWNFKEGDQLKVGDVLCEVETDKSTVGFEVQDDFILAKILIESGQKIKVGSLIAIGVSKSSDVLAFKEYKPKLSQAAPVEQKKVTENLNQINSSSSSTVSQQQQQQQNSLNIQKNQEIIKKTQQELVQKQSQNQQPINSDLTNKSYPQHLKIKMPSLSPTMEKGRIQKWNFKVGDKLVPGDVLCEVETDKSTVGFEVQEEFFLAKILISEGAKGIKIGQIVAIGVDKQNLVSLFQDYQEGQKASSSNTVEQQKIVSPQQEVQKPPQQLQTQQQQQVFEFSNVDRSSLITKSGERVFASPIARKLAAEQGIPLESIPGTGPGGRIIQQDVLRFTGGQKQQLQSNEQQQQNQQLPLSENQQSQFIQSEQQQQLNVQQQQQSSSSQPQQKQQQKDKISKSSQIQYIQAPNPYIDQQVSTMRQVIASRLLLSKTSIPHYYLTVNIEMDEVLKVRKQLNDQNNLKISVNDYIVKASALALRDFPTVNASWLGDKIRQYKFADISIAVSIDGGLITPIVFSADQKGLIQISNEIKSLAKKAKEGKLKPNEFQGGTFSISNLGMFGIDQFSAVINPPQSCILAVSAANKQIVPDENNKEHPFRVANVMSVTLSCDHRVVDGAVGAQWLQKLKFYLEKPLNMLL